MKKAQGLSMTTIVIAALALLVLVVLTLIFTGRMGTFARGLDENTDCNTYCESSGYAGGYKVISPNPLICDSDKEERKVRLTSTHICCCQR